MAKPSSSTARRGRRRCARASDVLALRLDAGEFRALVDAHPDIRTYLELQRKHARLQAFFRNVPAFARLPPEAVAGVVLAELEPVALDADETVYRQGDRAGPLYLIEEGRLRVHAHDNGRAGPRRHARRGRVVRRRLGAARYAAHDDGRSHDAGPAARR